ncbi:MAG: hypothetical protein AAFX94_09980, partial [Myxococcota bacterium]
FQVCDGSVIQDPESPFFRSGQTTRTPNLVGLFTRGATGDVGSISGSDTHIHEATFPAHSHTVSLPSHNHLFEALHTHTLGGGGSHSHSLSLTNRGIDTNNERSVSRLNSRTSTLNPWTHNHPVSSQNIGGGTGAKSVSRTSDTLSAQTRTTAGANSVPDNYGLIKLIRIK